MQLLLVLLLLLPAVLSLSYPGSYIEPDAFEDSPLLRGPYPSEFDFSGTIRSTDFTLEDPAILGERTDNFNGVNSDLRFASFYNSYLRRGDVDYYAWDTDGTKNHPIYAHPAVPHCLTYSNVVVNMALFGPPGSDTVASSGDNREPLPSCIDTPPNTVLLARSTLDTSTLAPSLLGPFVRVNYWVPFGINDSCAQPEFANYSGNSAPICDVSNIINWNWPERNNIPAGRYWFLVWEGKRPCTTPTILRRDIYHQARFGYIDFPTVLFQIFPPGPPSSWPIAFQKTVELGSLVGQITRRYAWIPAYNLCQVPPQFQL
jgi:hypothetical protein